MRLINFIILCTVLILTTLPARSESIGDVTLSKGNSVIDRKDGEKDVKVEKNLDIFSYDTVKTGKGQVAIEFLDETRVDITQHSKLIIDDFVYDPNAKTGKLSLKATLGTVRYASGQIAKNSAQNISIKTPTATVSVRGTDFAMTIDEIGSSTIILLPSCNGAGNCFVGEISVESDAGQVILNQAFQATQVDTPESSPLKPVLLDLDETLINNLLIVQKPPALADAIEQEEKLLFNEPNSFSLGKDNSLTGVSSDKFSFIDSTSDELSASGNAGLRQMYNYYSIDNKDETIITPMESDKKQKLNMNIEQLEEKRRSSSP